jgi:5-formyltetrahydrofolate cyclo-ligase
MDEIRAAKEQIRKDVAKVLNGFTEKQRVEKTRAIERKLFEFANFLEARIILLYVEGENEVRTKHILKRSFDFNKIVVLPAFDPERRPHPDEPSGRGLYLINAVADELEIENDGGAHLRIRKRRSSVGDG